MNASFHFRFKIEYQRAALCRRDLSFRAKLVLVGLFDHFNCKTGRCYPKRETLAKELGTGLKTISRGLTELEQAGWIKRRLTRGAPWYSFPLERLQEAGTNLSHLPVEEGDEAGTHLSGRGDSFDRKLRLTLSHGTEKTKKGIKNGEASPLPRKGEASASREAATRRKPNGSEPAEPPRLPEEERRKQADRVSGGKWRRL